MKDKLNNNFVSSEIAEKLKTLGFDEPCFGWYEYDEDGEFLTLLQGCNRKHYRHVNGYFGVLKQDLHTTKTLAPLHQQAQKWLREIHNIHINIKHRPHSQKFCFNITGDYQLGNDGELFSNIFSSYNTYELALEEGIKQALLLIK